MSREGQNTQKVEDTLTEPNACTINPAELLEIDVTAMSTMKFPGRCPAKNCRSICKSLEKFATHMRTVLHETAAKSTQRNHLLLVPKLPAGFPLKAVKEFQIALGSPVGQRLVKSVMESHLESRKNIVDVQNKALDVVVAVTSGTFNALSEDNDRSCDLFTARATMLGPNVITAGVSDLSLDEQKNDPEHPPVAEPVNGGSEQAPFNCIAQQIGLCATETIHGFEAAHANALHAMEATIRDGNAKMGASIEKLNAKHGACLTEASTNQSAVFSELIKLLPEQK